MLRRQSGFTLIELLIVVVIMGLISMLAFPRIKDAYQASALAGARARVVTLFNAARATAVETNRPVRMHFNGNTIWVTATPRFTTSGSGTADTIGPVQSVYGVYGVSVNSSVDSLLLDSRGLGMNGGSIILSNGHGADTVTITGFGRVIR